ncbi:beta-CASP ribonuclease aCPSF1 [Candidatus Woesearchaeota archaeon CG10_big_fil_rev_8_21_14_0_10_37_12]|nr:MAG: beta-CASP ribonuclease aCPSF1 [Candidatus Woesearchaeota archaeon CG10_big_fil_rev_8_21_14_0_10_37_12]
MEIIKEILKFLPSGKIDDASFEGANIVLYTKDKKFFLDSSNIIREVVNEFKKRVELRPDPSITEDKDKSEKEIRKILPEEAGVSQVLFDEKRSIVIIEADKPGLAIGKQGSLLKDIREKTFWIPQIRRTPALKSQLIENIRAVLHENSEERRKFLDKTGHRVYDGWLREKKHEWIRVTHLGAARQVGRSCIFLQTPESRILLDCGIDVSSEGVEAYPILDAPEFNIQQLDAIVLTHAHIDHSGFIPYLYKMGFRGPVYCTEPTRDVAALLMLDMVKIMKSENKEPLFDTDDVKEFVKHCITLNWEEVSDITPDVRLTLYCAGHILGSSMAHLHIGNGLHNLLYTGDLKYGKTPLLDPAHTIFPRLETVIMEGTYGGKTDIGVPAHEADEQLCSQIKLTLKRGGKVLMPVLGSGRAQDIMVMVESMVRRGELEEVPVYIDGMVWDITAIHTAYPEYLNSSLRKLIFHKDQNPFLNPIFKRVGSAKERKQVIEDSGPAIIMATSGMMVGGPSVEYFKHLADNPKNSIIFTCYLPPGTLSRRIFGGESEIIFKNGNKQEVVPVKLEVCKIAVTDHSDRKQLMNFVFKCQPRPKKVIVQHGESTKVLDLASAIHKLGRIETVAPKNLETVRIR